MQPYLANALEKYGKNKTITMSTGIANLGAAIGLGVYAYNQNNIGDSNYKYYALGAAGLSIVAGVFLCPSPKHTSPVQPIPPSLNTILCRKLNSNNNTLLSTDIIKIANQCIKTEHNKYINQLNTFNQQQTIATASRMPLLFNLVYRNIKTTPSVVSNSPTINGNTDILHTVFLMPDALVTTFQKSVIEDSSISIEDKELFNFAVYMQRAANANKPFNDITNYCIEEIQNIDQLAQKYNTTIQTITKHLKIKNNMLAELKGYNKNDREDLLQFIDDMSTIQPLSDFFTFVYNLTEFFKNNRSKEINRYTKNALEKIIENNKQCFIQYINNQKNNIPNAVAINKNESRAEAQKKKATELKQLIENLKPHVIDKNMEQYLNETAQTLDTDIKKYNKTNASNNNNANNQLNANNNQQLFDNGNINNNNNSNSNNNNNNYYNNSNNNLNFNNNVNNNSNSQQNNSGNPAYNHSNNTNNDYGVNNNVNNNPNFNNNNNNNNSNNNNLKNYNNNNNNNNNNLNSHSNASAKQLDIFNTVLTKLTAPGGNIIGKNDNKRYISLTFNSEKDLNNYLNSNQNTIMDAQTNQIGVFIVINNQKFFTFYHGNIIHQILITQNLYDNLTQHDSTSISALVTFLTNNFHVINLTAPVHYDHQKKDFCIQIPEEKSADVAKIQFDINNTNLFSGNNDKSNGNSNFNVNNNNFNNNSNNNNAINKNSNTTLINNMNEVNVYRATAHRFYCMSINFTGMSAKDRKDIKREYKSRIADLIKSQSNNAQSWYSLFQQWVVSKGDDKTDENSDKVEVVFTIQEKDNETGIYYTTEPLSKDKITPIYYDKKFNGPAYQAILKDDLIILHFVGNKKYENQYVQISTQTLKNTINTNKNIQLTKCTNQNLISHYNSYATKKSGSNNATSNNNNASPGSTKFSVIIDKVCFACNNINEENCPKTQQNIDIKTDPTCLAYFSQKDIAGALSYANKYNRYMHVHKKFLNKIIQFSYEKITGYATSSIGTKQREKFLKSDDEVECSTCGNKAESCNHRRNEDAFCAENIDSHLFFGVADGHTDQEDNLFSQYVLDEIKQKITTLIQTKNSISTNDLYFIHNEVHQLCATKKAGSTLTYMLIDKHKEKAYIASLGDSPLIFVTDRDQKLSFITPYSATIGNSTYHLILGFQKRDSLNTINKSLNDTQQKNLPTFCTKTSANSVFGDGKIDDQSINRHSIIYTIGKEDLKKIKKVLICTDGYLDEKDSKKTLDNFLNLTNNTDGKKIFEELDKDIEAKNNTSNDNLKVHLLDQMKQQSESTKNDDDKTCIVINLHNEDKSLSTPASSTNNNSAPVITFPLRDNPSCVLTFIPVDNNGGYYTFIGDSDENNINNNKDEFKKFTFNINSDNTNGDPNINNATDNANLTNNNNISTNNVNNNKDIDIFIKTAIDEIKCRFDSNQHLSKIKNPTTDDIHTIEKKIEQLNKALSDQGKLSEYTAIPWEIKLISSDLLYYTGNEITKNKFLSLIKDNIDLITKAFTAAIKTQKDITAMRESINMRVWELYNFISFLNTPESKKFDATLVNKFVFLFYCILSKAHLLRNETLEQQSPVNINTILKHWSSAQRISILYPNDYNKELIQDFVKANLDDEVFNQKLQNEIINTSNKSDIIKILQDIAIFDPTNRIKNMLQKIIT